MKNKIFALILVFAGLQACSMDTVNLTQIDSATYPKSEDDYSSLLISVYTNAAYTKMAHQHPYLVSELNSDQRFGGGGLHDINVEGLNLFKLASNDMLENCWTNRYTGIYQANFILEKLAENETLDQETKDKISGQAHFLRAYLYMDLARMFEKVPLILTTNQPDEIKQDEPAVIWAQIFTDLNAAIAELPNQTYQEMPADNDGDATKWAAESLMARAYLFYTGFYELDAAPLNEGGTLTKTEVVNYVDDCVANSGHQLLSDFRNYWPYSVSDKDYGYAKAYNLKWVDEFHSNPECVWATKYNGFGDRESTANTLLLAMGMRDQTQVPFGKGWGYGTVNPQTWENWPDNDLRKVASIYSVENEKEWVSGYKKAVSQADETGYWQKKYMPINMYDADHKATGYATVLYGAYNKFTMNTAQDLTLIRFSDVLLMGAELGSSHAQEYLDKVRSRVNLPAVPVTLDNIKTERNHELAFEGIRYYDLLRWHDAEAAFAKVKEVPIESGGVATTMTINYRKDTRGFMPIPETEISLANGGIVQNPGWTSAEAAW